MVRILRVIGQAWIVLAGIAIFIGYAAIAYEQGFARLMDIMSPYNIWNYIAIVLTLSPGLFCIWGADKIEERQKRRD